jgi:hypothetical protein
MPEGGTDRYWFRFARGDLKRAGGKPIRNSREKMLPARRISGTLSSPESNHEPEY